jgi:hypothetical protein
MDMTEQVFCPICGQDCTHARRDGRAGVIFFDCPTCGEYGISKEADLYVRDLSKSEKIKLSAYLRARDIRRDPPITLLTQVNSEVSHEPPVIAVRDAISEHFPSLVSERLDRTLQNIYRRSTYPGERIQFTMERDYPVFFAENREAMIFLARTLEERGWIDCTLSMQDVDVRLTEGGWARIAELESGGTRKESRVVFVAMWFDESLKLAWKEGFQKAIEATGYQALRIDLKEHNEKICDSIIAEIRKSRFLVADFTGHRGGVYYEAGFAKGLGMEVIWTCREIDLENTHFDTRQYNHIVWKDEKDLFEKLKRRIEATIPIQ